MIHRISFTARQELYDALRQAADADERSMGQVIRRALREHLPPPAQPARLLEEAHDVVG